MHIVNWIEFVWIGKVKEEKKKKHFVGFSFQFDLEIKKSIHRWAAQIFVSTIQLFAVTMAWTCVVSFKIHKKIVSNNSNNNTKKRNKKITNLYENIKKDTEKIILETIMCAFKQRAWVKQRSNNSQRIAERWNEERKKKKKRSKNTQQKTHIHGNEAVDEKRQK